jgi:hypothetical protein
MEEAPPQRGLHPRPRRGENPEPVTSEPTSCAALPDTWSLILA